MWEGAVSLLDTAALTVAYAVGQNLSTFVDDEGLQWILPEEQVANLPYPYSTYNAPPGSEGVDPGRGTRYCRSMRKNIWLRCSREERYSGDAGLVYGMYTCGGN